MMTSDLSIILRREEGVLVRVLGLLVRRRFEPLRVDARPIDGTRMRMDVTVYGEHPVAMVVRQLEKLYDVESVTLRLDLRHGARPR